MTVLTREIILANRKKWIDFLRLPNIKKATGALVDYNDHYARCCLGHACVALDYPEDMAGLIEITGFGPIRFYDETAVAPSQLVEDMGLWDDVGGYYDVEKGRNSISGTLLPFFKIWELHSRQGYDLSLSKDDENFVGESHLFECSTSLAALNDDTKATPQQIADYLESVIYGGHNTPFRPLSDYPE